MKSEREMSAQDWALEAVDEWIATLKTVEEIPNVPGQLLALIVARMKSHTSQEVEKQKQRDAEMVRGRAGEFDSASWVTSRHVGSLLNELATTITSSEKGEG